MRITMVGSLPPIKGVSDYCIQQTEALSPYVDIDFINFRHIYPERLYPGGTTERDDTFRARNCRGLRVREMLNWFNPCGWLWAGLSTRGRLFHIHWWTFYLAPVFIAMLAAVKARRIPVVMTVHNVLAHESGRLDWLLTRTAFQFVDRFIVHTRENRRQMQRFFNVPLRRTTVIPHGIYTFYDDGEISREAAREELGIQPDERVMLAFGNIRPYKGLDVLLEALVEVRREVENVRLIIAGACWEDWSTYQRIIDERGLADAVTLNSGYVSSSKIKVYFRAADILALPYHHFEAQSGPGNIALAFGTPMVVTRTGGLPDLVRDPEAVVPPGDVDALSNALAACLGDPHRLERMRKDSAALKEDYSWSRIAERTVALYEEVLRS